ncbi:MAG TPA: DNA translocase FtsK 4TM domain-containing protein [Polyangia bacterium]|nr:DNA translocase FtsK 4TM domain-containing protein [Polyangia bacterium]
MAARTKTTDPSESAPRGNRQNRRREISGILLLAAGLFAAMSLVSMQVGGDPLMGPGGGAVATGLYSLFGFCAYLVIAAASIAAVRCFRARPLVDGLREGSGALLLLCAIAVLLHLPFAGSDVSLHGPGGLFGQWLGEVGASFIGAVGAALAATTMLVVGVLLVTEISLQEAMVVISWAARHARRGLVAGALAAWRTARAAFPEKDDAGERHRELEPAAESEHEQIAIVEAVRAGALESESELEPDCETNSAPARIESQESEAIRVGAPRTIADDVAEERAAMAAIVAEVAAVERFAADEVEAEDALAVVAAAAPVIPPDAPIIVESASLARMRLSEAAAEAAGDDEAVEKTPEEKVGEKMGFIRLSEGAFKLPTTDLLEYIPPPAHEMDKQQLYEMAERLEQAMSNYGVRGKVKEIHMGPVVTMYEFAPAPGTRTGKIANLEKDLAMALEAQAVRIVAPIPGKAVVGVEVPNLTREIVYLKEILQDTTFTGAASKLQVALGKDIKGAPVTVNLSKMPHLLVAGTTGSGKSVAVNGMITSILYNASPEEVRFIMVDPKMLELSIYEGIPHLLLPVVTDPKKANLALRWAVDEMERRYELLAKTGVRDVATYNAKIDAANSKAAVPEAPARKEKKIRVVLAGPDGTEQEVDLDADAEITVAEAGDGDGAGIVEYETPSDEDLSDVAAAAQATQETAAAPKPTKLPYIVIVIDEFADLMMVAPKDVETSVARLAQKARAAGLHLILATQRPSVDVITGLIKANFPSRVALQVASKIDSRTILDQSGAETLLGNGDMLFSDRGTKLRRIHGAFLSDDEVHRVVDFLKKQAKPVYDMDILKPREEDAEEGGGPADSFHDDLYDQAVAIVCDTRQASVSYIQRRLQIGYNRSARMVEQMERDGIVGPTNGAKPRDVLAPQGEYLAAGG